MMDSLSGPNLSVAKRRDLNALECTAVYDVVLDASLDKKGYFRMSVVGFAFYLFALCTVTGGVVYCG